jgi:hypothetical protein
MANWKKVIVSGSNAELNSLSVTNNTSITGSLTVSGSVSLKGLTELSASYIVGYTPSTGDLFYASTGSVVSVTASYAMSASQAVSASYATTASYALSSTSGSYALTASYAETASQAVSASYAISASQAVSASYAHTASYVNTLNQDVIISGSLTVTNSVKGTGSLILQPDKNDSRFLEVYNTSPTDTHITASGGQIFLGNDVTYVKVDNYGSVKRIDIVADNGVNISSSLNITGSTRISGSLSVNEIYPTSSYSTNRIFLENSNVGFGPTGSIVIYTSAVPLVLSAGSGTEAVQITGSLNIQNGATGSFSGSFHGDGSGLTNVTASNPNALSQSTGITAFNYNGSSAATVAISGAAELIGNFITKWNSIDGKFVTSSITDNISGVTINTSAGVLIQQGGLYVTGSSTFHNDLTVQGNLTVAGTASFQNTQNLAIADQFILLNSGSATFQDSGFVINTGNPGNSGSAWFLETAGTTTGAPQNGRFAVAGGVAPNATTVTAEEYANTTKIAGTSPTTEVPQFGGSGLGQGNMWVNSESGEIYIYA